MAHVHVVVVVAHIAAAEERGRVLNRIAGGRLRGHLAKEVARELDQLIVVHRARGGHHHARRSVVGGDVGLDVVGGDGLDVRLRPEDGARERRADVRDLVQHVEDDLLGHVFDLLHLAQDDVALALNRRRREGRVSQDVRQQLDRLRHILLEHLGVVDRLLA